jgi:L-arabinonolactonase
MGRIAHCLPVNLVSDISDTSTRDKRCRVEKVAQGVVPVRAELVVDCRNAHGEGVLWSHEHGLLMWTDINGERIWTYDPVTGKQHSHKTPGRVGCFAPREGRPSHELIAGFADAFALVDLTTGKRKEIAAFEPDLPTTRLNDGRTDRAGRLIAGGMDEAALAPISSVWRVDADLGVTRLFGGVSCANSACFSPDGRRMYFADSPTKTIVAIDYEPASGELGEKRVLATVDGIPDGSCVDSEGCIWNAVWEGYRVERWSPDGELVQVVEVPVRKPTCCAFGGADLATLYITTSRLMEDDENLRREPTAGSLYSVMPRVRGLADRPFAG